MVMVTGIGTTSPNAKFELNNSSDISMFKIKSGNGNDDVGKDFVIEAYQPSISFIDRSTGGNSSAISYNQNSIHFSDLNSIGDIGQKMTINTETGKVGIGTTNPQAKLEINDNSASSKLVIRNYAHYFGYGIDFYGKAGHTGFTPLNFRNSNGTIVGQVNHNNSSTSYNTSDYRLKEDISEITDSVARLQALKPCNFRWKADGTRVDGFIAHEAQAVVPAAVSGTKDAVDAEGNPQYQGIDHGKLVPLLTKALQEALTRIETLEAEVAQLKQRKGHSDPKTCQRAFVHCFYSLASHRLCYAAGQCHPRLDDPCVLAAYWAF